MDPPLIRSYLFSRCLNEFLGLGAGAGVAGSGHKNGAVINMAGNRPQDHEARVLHLAFFLPAVPRGESHLVATVSLCVQWIVLPSYFNPRRVGTSRIHYEDVTLC